MLCQATRRNQTDNWEWRISFYLIDRIVGAHGCFFRRHCINHEASGMDIAWVTKDGRCPDNRAVRVCSESCNSYILFPFCTLGCPYYAPRISSVYVSKENACFIYMYNYVNKLLLKNKQILHYSIYCFTIFSCLNTTTNNNNYKNDKSKLCWPLCEIRWVTQELHLLF